MCLQINLPGTPFRKALEARQKLLAVIRPNSKQAIEDLKAGKFDQLRRKSTMQNYMATANAEGDTLDAEDIAVRVQDCRHSTLRPGCGW